MQRPTLQCQQLLTCSRPPAVPRISCSPAHWCSISTSSSISSRVSTSNTRVQRRSRVDRAVKGSSCARALTALPKQSQQQRPQQQQWLHSSMYDTPAIYSNDDAFSERVYWDRRYTQDRTTFEWYRSYDSLKPILTQHLPRAQPILQLGVGTSRIQEDMADDGYSSITSIDYSSVAIQRLQQTYPLRPQLQYAVADARSMPQYGSSSFGGVLDKGTLDALLCGDDDVAAAAQLLGEVWRLLAPGGAYVMVTSAAPKSRLQYLQTPATPWQQLLVYEVGQEGAMAGPFLCSCSSSSSTGSSTGGSGGEAGSSSGGSSDGARSSNPGCSNTSSSGDAGKEGREGLGDVQQQLQQALQLPQMGYSHLVYVCYKP